MTNEAKWAYATPVTLVSSGASIASAGFSTNVDTTLTSANHSNYQFADFVLMTSGFGASLTSTQNGYVVLYQRELDMTGNTNADGIVPSTAYRNKFVGSFTMPNSQASTGVLYHNVNDVPLLPGQEFYLENLAGQSLTAGWSLVARPKTPYPSA